MSLYLKHKLQTAGIINNGAVAAVQEKISSAARSNPKMSQNKRCMSHTIGLSYMNLRPRVGDES